MEDFIAGWQTMPTWAQIVVGWFALTFVVMLVTPSIDYRRHRGRIRRLAQALGATATRGSEQWPVGFKIEVDGRSFDVTYQCYTRRAGDLRPSGHVLVTSTPLAGQRWSTVEVDIVPGTIPRWFRRKDLPDQDAPFQVRSINIDRSWFDAGCRAAVTAFYALSRELGPMLVQEQVLVHAASTPWPVADGEALRELLRRQAAVAQAFERAVRSGHV